MEICPPMCEGHLKDTATAPLGVCLTYTGGTPVCEDQPGPARYQTQGHMESWEFLALTAFVPTVQGVQPCLKARPGL